MTTHEQAYDDDPLDNALPALGWIVLAAMVSVIAFLLAPLP
jgi:hypothetical protein